MSIKEEIWIEKYRPEKLDDIVGQDEIIRRLKSYVKTRNLPHLLFSGPPGVGKTAASISIVKEIFGDTWRNNFIELNASDERGIDIIRHKVKDFARMAPLGEADFKVIFLDEADALTNDAQSALRRTMERYSATTRFILSCNYSSKIIEPIQSRCAVYRFKPLSRPGRDQADQIHSRGGEAAGLGRRACLPSSMLPAAICAKPSTPCRRQPFWAIRWTKIRSTRSHPLPSRRRFEIS